MYTYIETVSLNRANGVRWVRESDPTKLIKDLFNHNIKTYLILHNTFSDEQNIIDLDCVQESHTSFEGSIEAFLKDIGNTTLPTVDELPDTRIKYARYENAARLRFKVSFAQAGVIHPNNYPIKELKDLRIHRELEPIDPRILDSNALISVNGFYHKTASDRNYLYVYGGGSTLHRSKVTHVGITSFQDMGGISEYKLNKDNILPLNPDSTLKEKIIFSVDTEVGDRSAILVLGGYLVFPEDGVFWRSGDNSYILDINRIPYINRLFESNPYIDLSPLGLHKSTLNENILNTEEIYSDEVLKRYLTLDQSFLVLVNQPYLTLETIPLRSGLIPSHFTSYQEPIYPLRLGHGRVSEYWKQEETSRWSVKVHDSYKRDYIISYRKEDGYVTVSDQVIPEGGFTHGPAHLLKIGGFSV